MNWLYIIIMGYIVASALRGFHKGFLRVVYSIAALLITILFVTLSVPIVTELIQKHTPIAESIQAGCKEYIQSAMDEKLVDGLFSQGSDNQTGILAMVPETLFDDLAAVTKDTLNESNVIDEMAEAAAAFLVSAIAFFVSTIVIQVVLFFVGRKLDLFARTPGIHIANMIMGFCAGIVKSFLVIWTFFFIIKVTSPMPWSKAIIELIEENDVLQSLYEQNRLVEILEKMPFLKV